MYFFYIDESGNRDVKVDEPYVLTAIGMYEGQWRGFNRHLSGMKTNIARGHDSNIKQDQLEVKANLLTNDKARQKNAFFKHLTDSEITHISKNYFDQLAQYNMDVLAVIIDKERLHDDTTAKKMHEKAYEYLLERIQNHMRSKYRKHNALIIMDDTGANLNRTITLMHARLLGGGNDNTDFGKIIEYPFFISSELSNGVQLADMVAYAIYHSFKYDKPDYEYLEKILPRIARHVDDPSILAGLKVWPEAGRFEVIFNKIQLKVK
jgi:hypothetical protein